MHTINAMILFQKLIWGWVVSSAFFSFVPAAVQFEARFAPHQGIVTAYERPQRQELCLNGRWQFQPVKLPEGFQWNRGKPPFLSDPHPDRWEAIPIKIPSAWNVNNWGLWAEPGPYDPVPLYYPSYPESWKHVRMGWLRKTFQVPAEWKDRRLVLHFNGVAGECRVMINGKVVVESHYDTFTPFEVDITETVDWTEANELLVGVRAHRLFNKAHPIHAWGWDVMGPRGSDMFELCGIYQDVYLLGLTPVYVEDVFVKSWLDRDTLEVDVTVRNTTNTAAIIQINGAAKPWKNLAGSDVLSAPEENWTLDEPVMPISAGTMTVPPEESKTISLSQTVENRLKLWAPEHPHLYGLVLSLTMDGNETYRKYTRFGWRQFTLQEGNVYLNGQKIRLYGDILHPFSSFIMTRRTAWAWYTMIQDFGGNAARPHAQPWPKFYIDVADEMGIVILNETGLFGSAGGFNMDEQEAWNNCRDHYEALILRDRNSPSVMGWSFANEMFALGKLNNIPDEKFDVYQARLADFGRIAYDLDPTREWISCDGDEDLNGRLPVWSKHWGDGWKDKKGIHYHLPQDDSKVLMLGEYSGSYYALPDRLDYLNGDRAYESYAGRVEALGIDIYELAVDIARHKLDYFSASETVWFGLEHLNFGYYDFSRLPNKSDGVFFTRPYQESLPGMQPERLPPFVTTLNPGWDPSLPLYKPLSMFEAMKAALAPGEPLLFSGRIPFRERPAVPTPTIEAVRFVGSEDSDVRAFLQKHNFSVTEDVAANFVIVDAHTAAKEYALKNLISETLTRGDTVLVMIQNNDADIASLNRILPNALTLTDRQAYSFVHGTEYSQTAPFSLKELFFVDTSRRTPMMFCGLDGPLVRESKVLLKASPVDWSLFDAPENRKCAALTLYEKLQKPSGAALVQWTDSQGRLLICSINITAAGPRVNEFWNKLFACFGVSATAMTSVQETEHHRDTRPHDLLRDGPLLDQ